MKLQEISRVFSKLLLLRLCITIPTISKKFYTLHLKESQTWPFLQNDGDFMILEYKGKFDCNIRTDKDIWMKKKILLNTSRNIFWNNSATFEVLAISSLNFCWIEIWRRVDDLTKWTWKRSKFWKLLPFFQYQYKTISLRTI